jgi:hypothetical protein
MRFCRLVLVFLILLAVSASLSADCTSSLCSDCEQVGTRGSCLSVSYSASCSCSVSVSTGFCILEGACQYTGGGSGGGDGGGTGGGGGGCSRPAGGWCPAECASCDTIYWY